MGPPPNHEARLTGLFGPASPPVLFWYFCGACACPSPGPTPHLVWWGFSYIQCKNPCILASWGYSLDSVGLGVAQLPALGLLATILGLHLGANAPLQLSPTTVPPGGGGGGPATLDTTEKIASVGWRDFLLSRQFLGLRAKNSEALFRTFCREIKPF